MNKKFIWFSMLCASLSFNSAIAQEQKWISVFWEKTQPSPYYLNINFPDQDICNKSIAKTFSENKQNPKNYHHVCKKVFNEDDSVTWAALMWKEKAHEPLLLPLMLDSEKECLILSTTLNNTSKENNGQIRKFACIKLKDHF